MNINKKRLILYSLIIVIIILLCILIYKKPINNLKVEEPFDVNVIYFMTNPKINGRFGNNVVQLIAAEIIRKLYNYQSIKSIEELPTGDLMIINDHTFFQIINDHLKTGQLRPLEQDKIIVLNGSFQKSEFLNPFREHILSFFSPNNCTNINSMYRICDVMKQKSNLYPEFDNENDLVLHLRLDDFKDHIYGGLFKSNEIKEKIIKKINYRRLYIVCDKLKYDWEKQYMNEFMDLDPIIVSGDLMDDWNFLRNAKKVVIRESTFAWSAAFLGKISEMHMIIHPNTPGTIFEIRCFIENCKLYNDIQLM